MADTTTNYDLPYPEGAVDFVKDGATAIQDLAEDVDSKFGGYSEGPFGSRPTSTGGTPGVAGRIYRATDTGVIYHDNGTGWDRLPRVVAVGSITWNPPSVAHGASTSTAVTGAGGVGAALPGDFIVCAFPNAAVNGLILTGQAGTGNVTVVLANLSGGAVDLASGTLTVMVLRP